MAKQEQRTARKDYPEAGIAKGDTYFFAQIKTGPRSSRTIRSKSPIPRSQLTTSSFLSSLYDIEDNGFEGVDSAEGLREVAERVRELGQEAQDSFDNMPEGLQQGQTGELLEERAQSCESWADDIESLADELEMALSEFDEQVEAYKTWLNDPEQDETDEPDLPDDLSPDEVDDEDAVAHARQELVDRYAQEAQYTNPGIN